MLPQQRLTDDNCHFQGSMGTPAWRVLLLLLLLLWPASCTSC
jgi:hypothetical protein